IARVTIHRGTVTIHLSADELLSKLAQNLNAKLGLEIARQVNNAAATMALSIPFATTTRGRAIRLIVGNTQTRLTASTHAILKAIAQSRRWYDQLVSGEATCIPDIARRECVTSSYVNRIFRLISLSPQSVESIVKGTNCADVTLDRLVNALPFAW